VAEKASLITSFEEFERVTGVTVRFLASSDAFGSAGRFQTCISVQWQDGHILIDCGASSLIAMKRSGVDPTSIDAVAASQFHGDQQFARRKRALVVAGPPGLRERVLLAMEVFIRAPRTPIAPSQWNSSSSRDPTPVDAATITADEVRHPSGAPACALRAAAGGRLVAYTGDSEWSEAPVEVARNADLFICEAYFFDKAIQYHVSYTTPRLHLPEWCAKRIVLTPYECRYTGAQSGRVRTNG
jgi:ribonuclease BN (tRNA processing enzyme)